MVDHNPRSCTEDPVTGPCSSSDMESFSQSLVPVKESENEKDRASGLYLSLRTTFCRWGGCTTYFMGRREGPKKKEGARKYICSIR